MALNAKRVLVALAGLVLTGGGLWLATQLGTSGSASFTMTPTRNGAVVVTPDVLNRLDGDFVVRAESAKSDGAVWMGEVAPSDADLIVGETGATRLTGFSVRDGWVLRHKLVGAGENPDFAAADIWRATISGKGSQTIVVDQASAPDAVIIAAEDGRVRRAQGVVRPGDHHRRRGSGPRLGGHPALALPVGLAATDSEQARER